MPQPISIIVIPTGVRLDVLPDAVIEVNMGGISLLNLQDRTGTYTNQFKLPRTPTNEYAFGFMSSPARKNRVSLSVVISKGLFTRTATLKVESFDGEYQCSISYNSTVLNALKGEPGSGKYEYLFNDEDLGVYAYDSLMIANLRDPVLSTTRILYLETYQQKIPSKGVVSKSLFVLLSDVLDAISVEYGVTIGGTLLSEADFIASYLCITGMTISKGASGGGYRYWTQVVDSGNLVTDLLKEIALIFFCEVEITGTAINLNKVTLIGVPVLIDGFTFAKTTTSGMAKSNYIKYTLAKSIIDKNFGADTITADGEGEKDLVTLKTYIPAATDDWNPGTSDYGLRILSTDADATGKIIIGTKAVYPLNTTITYLGGTFNFTYGYDPDSYVFLMYTLSGYYSTLLDPIFAYPVIIDASGWLDPITADILMTSRLILSSQLQGLYWVDSMAYDLTSGRVKMTLIKLIQ